MTGVERIAMDATPRDTGLLYIIGGETRGIGATRRANFVEREVVRALRSGNSDKLISYLSNAKRSIHYDVLRAVHDRPKRLVVPEFRGGQAHSFNVEASPVLVELINSQIENCLVAKRVTVNFIEMISSLCVGPLRGNGNSNFRLRLAFKSERKSRGPEPLPANERLGIATKIGTFMIEKGHVDVATRGGLRGEKHLLHSLGLKRSRLREIWTEFHEPALELLLK